MQNVITDQLDFDEPTPTPKPCIKWYSVPVGNKGLTSLERFIFAELHYRINERHWHTVTTSTFKSLGSPARISEALNSLEDKGVFSCEREEGRRVNIRLHWKPRNVIRVSQTEVDYFATKTRGMAIKLAYLATLYCLRTKDYAQVKLASLAYELGMGLSTLKDQMKQLNTLLPSWRKIFSDKAEKGKPEKESFISPLNQINVASEKPTCSENVNPAEPVLLASLTVDSNKKQSQDALCRMPVVADGDGSGGVSVQDLLELKLLRKRRTGEWVNQTPGQKAVLRLISGYCVDVCATDKAHVVERYFAKFVINYQVHCDPVEFGEAMAECLVGVIDAADFIGLTKRVLLDLVFANGMYRRTNDLITIEG